MIRGIDLSAFHAFFRVNAMAAAAGGEEEGGGGGGGAHWVAEYERAPSKQAAKTALCHILRKGWRAADVCPAGALPLPPSLPLRHPHPPSPFSPAFNPPPPHATSHKRKPGYDRAHYFDVELAAESICRMPGPKPSLDYLDRIADCLRGGDNWRPLLHDRNLKECRWVNEMLSGGRITVDGHFKSKVAQQAAWLIRHRESLGDGFVSAAATYLDLVYDDAGHKVFDRRRL